MARPHKGYQIALSKGEWNCVGINFALGGLFRAITAVARYDMKLFKTGHLERGVSA